MTDQQTAPGDPGPGSDGDSGRGSDRGSGVPAAGPPPLRGLRRSRGHKMISGVCGGLGRHYDLDPVIFRVVFAVLGLAGGVGLIAYGFAWLLIPLDGEDENEGKRLLSGRVEGQALTALLFALVGCGLLLSTVQNPAVLFFSVAVAGALAGSAHWSQRRRAEQESAADTAGETGADGAKSGAGKGTSSGSAAAPVGVPPETQAPPAPGGPSWWRDPLTKDEPGGTGYLWGPAEAALPPAAQSNGAAAPAADRPGTEAPTARRRPAWIGGWTFLAAVAACAAGVLATWDSRPLGTSLQTGLACALAVFGLGLAISALYGRFGGGTFILALLTAGLLVCAAALPKSVSSDWVRTDWKPTSASAVRPDYGLGSGIGTLDLSGVKLGADQTVSTRASVGAGQLKVVVPADAAVNLDVEVGLGDLRLPGERPRDVDVTPGIRERITLRPAGGDAPRGTLDLELETGVGQVEVTRAAP
ncbi:PspC domain-containing protein [Streptomyces pathocidini]|uniref:PspC domain-containing protein n=1 Tax=Streptomyces pathocidini TaxID=1650571 RepID=UPI0033D103D3